MKLKRQKKAPHLLYVPVHLPPNAPGTHDAKIESVEALADDYSVSSLPDPALFIGDMNSRPGENIPGPDMLAKLIGGKTYGTKIDCVVARGLRRVKVTYPEHVGKVTLKSDHHHAVRVTFWVGLRFYVVWFYNLQVGRPSDIRDHETQAILKSRTMGRRPLAVGVSEAVNCHFTRTRGYTLIRDSSRNGRANIATYVRTGRLVNWHWIDMARTWARNQHGHTGEHPARSYPIATLRLRRPKK